MAEMRTAVVKRTSVFPAGAETVWPLLGQIEMLQYIAKPYAVFTSVDGKTDWREGETYRLTLKLFGVISLGTHEIHVLRGDAQRRSILTQEGNPFVPLWEHEISLVPCAGGCRYTDSVTLGAGWKTPMIRVWADCFYRHRQRKWIKFLKKGEPRI